jgi:uridine kinase
VALRGLFDRIGYLDVDDAVRIERLVARHVHHGRSHEEALEFVQTSDEANAAVIAATRSFADVLIDPSRP